ncbi:unnamed protein product [Nippostrongylus brasiliensis]|uniref:U4/U6 small nuclear ribonucleoprotein Prp31 (inferred by orthology to a human protein) n=1 Tax=Nippostrongylus brasiliensis TaxID=27835 RepID=A0A0N4XNM0_NIPBR|nr:unnamed protein product [Nippostrongylus brasiliensis]
MKERMGMTDLRKSANRMNFGELAEDVLQDHLGFDLGQVKTGNVAGGRIRAGVVDNKTRVKMSQKMQRQMERQRAQGGVTSIRSKVSHLLNRNLLFTIYNTVSHAVILLVSPSQLRPGVVNVSQLWPLFCFASTCS